MRTKSRVVVLISSALLVASLSVGSASPATTGGRSEPTTCIWGGTPASPLGRFVIPGGLRTSPSTEPLWFRATGPAQGRGCKSRVTFEGVIEPGSSCAALVFSGTVTGVSGVATFYGPGQPVNTHEILYDKDGDEVGFNDPSTANEDMVRTIVEPPFECGSEEGLTSGSFSSVITVFPRH